jgi:hypothetical protein
VLVAMLLLATAALGVRLFDVAAQPAPRRVRTSATLRLHRRWNNCSFPALDSAGAGLPSLIYERP